MSGSAPSSRPNSSAKPIGDLLPGALRALGVPTRAASKRIHAAWTQVAAPSWKDRAAPLRLQGGVLTIGVGSAPLRDELAQHHAERLLGALKDALTEDHIVSIRFVAGERGVS